MLKKILIALLIILVVIQFIRPEKNIATGAQPNDISAVYPMPEHVSEIVKTVCYDCHSNQTVYPWYFNVQPLAWWLDHHIDEGKEHLNFSEFKTYPLKKQAHKFEELAEMVENGEMPLKSYTWTHKPARLNSEERQILINWANEMQEEISLAAGLGTTLN
jgi:hypothetical protein